MLCLFTEEKESEIMAAIHSCFNPNCSWKFGELDNVEYCHCAEDSVEHKHCPGCSQIIHRNIMFDTLIEKARDITLTPKEREEQRRSFAYGNLKMSRPDLTREDIDKAADKIKLHSQ